MTLREPRPKEYDHYPDRELDPKSEERRAFENAMHRYWRDKERIPLAPNIPCTRLSDVFDQSLGDDNSYAVQTSTRLHVVFHNTVVKIKTKMIEFGGDGFVTRPLVDNKSGCKAVAFDDVIHPTDVQRCLHALCPDLILDTSRTLACDSSDTWLLVL